MNKHLYDTIATNWLRPTGNSVWIFSDPHFGDFDSMRFRHLIKVPDKKDYFSRFKDGDIFETYETFISKEIAKANEELIKRINSKLNRNDTIIFLGDIGDIGCVRKIKGYKVLVLGNHDKGASNYKRNNVGYIDTEHKDENGKYKWVDGDNHLFDEVYEGPLMINDRVILSHEPIEHLPAFMYNIHGHIHNKDYHGDAQHLNVCAEAIDFTPINMLKLFKDGLLKDIPNIHRPTIDTAIERKAAKEKKKRGSKK